MRTELPGHNHGMDEQRQHARVEELRQRLDDVLPALGYHCLHDCAWPRDDRPKLNHVVIGRGGVFVIEDKFMAHEIRGGTDGRIWSGGVSLDPEIESALTQADALADVLGTPVTAVLALHDSHVSALPVVRGVHLFAASEVLTFLERRPAHRSPAAVANLAAKARTLLRPAASTPMGSGPHSGAARQGSDQASRAEAGGRRRLTLALLIVLLLVALACAYFGLPLVLGNMGVARTRL